MFGMTSNVTNYLNCNIYIYIIYLSCFQEFQLVARKIEEEELRITKNRGKEDNLFTLVKNMSISSP